jgi:hypothetical protein
LGRPFSDQNFAVKGGATLLYVMLSAHSRTCPEQPARESPIYREAEKAENVSGKIHSSVALSDVISRGDFDVSAPGAILLSTTAVIA